ncbi:MAG: aquaporin [Demequina sp.]
MPAPQHPEADSADFQADLTDDSWEHEVTTPSLLARMVAEFLGTFVLVLMVVSALLFTAGGPVQIIAVGFAFGFTTLAAMVAIGRTSGGHINPAVSVGYWLAGRFPGKDVAPYILAQTLGGIVAAGTMATLLATNVQVSDTRQAMTATAVGYGEFSPGQFPLAAGLVVELFAGALLMAIILSATSLRAHPTLAPLGVGFGLVVLVMWAHTFTNAGLNPARATASAVFADSAALGQLWLWWFAPVAGAAVVGMLYRAFGPEEDFQVSATATEPPTQTQ